MNSCATVRTVFAARFVVAVRALASLVLHNESWPLFIACIAGGYTMARRKSKKKSSHKFLKSVILLIIFALIWLVFQYPPVSSRIKNAVREYLPKQKTVQTVHEPKVKPTPHVPEPDRKSTRLNSSH